MSISSGYIRHLNDFRYLEIKEAMARQEEKE